MKTFLSITIAYVLLFGGYKSYEIWSWEHPIADLSNEVYDLASLTIKGN